MNVKSLKETLKDVPDDYIVIAKVGDEKFELSALDISENNKSRTFFIYL